MSKYLLFLTFVVAFALCSTSRADDIMPPDWRGEENTTWQAWEFFDDENPAWPDFENNPYGDPYAEIDLGASTSWYQNYLGEDGVWMVQENLELYIPNYQNPNPYKDIYLQMTYHPGDLGYEPLIRIDYGQGLYEYAYPTHTAPMGEFTYSVWEARIEPNPVEEWITIKPAFCSFHVDEVVVDTACVPEPATVVLLGLGGVLLLGRKKSIRL